MENYIPAVAAIILFIRGNVLRRYLILRLVGLVGTTGCFMKPAERNWPTIDATPAIKIIHQDHDYSHLPGGQSHYRLPETTENIRLAGGRRTIFTLLDVNYEFRDGSIRKFPIGWKKFWREVEIFPLIR